DATSAGGIPSPTGATGDCAGDASTKIIRPGRASAGSASPLISRRSAIGTSARFAIVSRLSPAATTCQVPAGLAVCSCVWPPKWQPARHSAAAMTRTLWHISKGAAHSRFARERLGRRLAAADAEAAQEIDVAAPGVIRGDVMVALPAHDRQFLLVGAADRDHQPP